MRGSRRLIDLSHPIRSGMDVYPGLPSPRVEAHISHAASRSSYGGLAEFTITRISLVGSTATYLDSPWHRHPTGRDLGGLRLDALADLPGVCVDAAGPQDREIRWELDGVGLRGRAVLIRTGWSQRWGTRRYWEPGPFLGAAAVERLVAARPALVGVDFWNADDPADLQRPAHTALLGAGIPIVEHLTGLDRLPDAGFRFFAVPPAIVDAATFPVRAFALVDHAGGATAPRNVRR
jgi:kynurenine formamidase